VQGTQRISAAPSEDQHRSAANALAREQIGASITNEDRARQVDIESACRGQQKTWLRLATGAAIFRLVRTPQDRVNASSSGPGMRDHAAVNVVNSIPSHNPVSNNALICDHEDGTGELRQRAERYERAR
jgi:hypothetical protein